MQVDKDNQKIQNNDSEHESSSFEDSDDEIFLNLAPVVNKNVTKASKAQEDKMLLAKMKRLIGVSLESKKAQENKKLASNSKKQQKSNKQQAKNEYVSESEPELNNQRQKSCEKFIQQPMQKFYINKTAQSLDSDSENNNKDFKSQYTANLSIQKQVKKQNDKLLSNTRKNEKEMAKFEKFAQIEKQLLIPVSQLPICTKTVEQEKQQKREKKRLDRMMEKKLKEYKVGKVKDQISNCVFNGIEDYFM